MKQKFINYRRINGWGIDADSSNEPTHPMKNYTGDDHHRSNWERPPLQVPKVEVLHSIERPDYSAVIGESVPPSGLSGQIRRFAFLFSESRYAHWLPLLLADRVNVVEGLVDDFRKGKRPNIFAERGSKAQLKYDTVGTIKKVAFAVIVIGVVCSVGKKKRRKRRKLRG